jgi:hypothetical protein
MTNTELRARFIGPGRSELYLADMPLGGVRVVVRDGLGTMNHVAGGVEVVLADGTELGIFESQPLALRAASRELAKRGDI